MKWIKLTIDTTTEAVDMISYMLGEMGIPHKVDLDEVIAISKELPNIIGRSDYPGQVVKAGKVSDLHEF